MVNWQLKEWNEKFYRYSSTALNFFVLPKQYPSGISSHLSFKRQQQHQASAAYSIFSS